MIVKIDFEMDAGEEAALVAADLRAAGPDAARTCAVARFDERLGVMRLHERIDVDPVLAVRALHFVRVKLVRIVVDRREHRVERVDRRGGIRGSSRVECIVLASNATIAASRKGAGV